MSTYIPPSFTVLDIETRPIPEAVDKFTKPFPDFDPAAVKYGNTKDPVKRAETLATRAGEHEAEKLAYWANARDRAALDPITGAIICIGLLPANGEPIVIAEATEAATIRQFWQIVELSDNALTKFVFWSGCGDSSKKFDMDFIVTRSFILRIPIPKLVREGRYYHRRFVDLAEVFLLGQRERYLSLTKAAELLGLYADHPDIFPKTPEDPVTGANFFQWWDGTAANHPANEQRAFAVKYLHNDLRTTALLAESLLA